MFEKIKLGIALAMAALIIGLATYIVFTVKLSMTRYSNGIAQDVLKSTFNRFQIAGTYTAKSFDALSQEKRRQVVLAAIKTYYPENIYTKFERSTKDVTIPALGEQLDINTEMPDNWGVSIGAGAGMLPLSVIVIIYILGNAQAQRNRAPWFMRMK